MLAPAISLRQAARCLLFIQRRTIITLCLLSTVAIIVIIIIVIMAIIILVYRGYLIVERRD